MQHIQTHRSSGVAALVIVVALTACDPNKALDVKDIDVLNPRTVTTKAALPALRNGVVSSFQVAYWGAPISPMAVTRGR